MRTYVLALEGVFDSGLSAILDTLTTAEDLAIDAARRTGRNEVGLVGVRRQVRTAQGLRVPISPAHELPRPDVVIVPALGCKTPDTLSRALLRDDVADARALLRRWARSGALVTAACTGTFVLAETSLLDGGSATTTWWLAPLFRERYPRVHLDDSRMIVESGRVVTAGAALAHFDLALWLVRRRSPSLAALVSRYLIIDSRPSQTLYAIPDHLAHSDPIVERFERWASRQLNDRFSLGAAARAAGVSQRTLARRLERVLGKSPLAYVHDLRVERAIHLLRTSDATIDQIAGQVGYSDGVTLRTLLRRKTGHGVRALREMPT
jgi:transcriptional regulator GlxA family with amidase domain